MTPTTKQITPQQLAELVFTLITNIPTDTDMAIVESAVKQTMKHNELGFKDYDKFLMETDGNLLAKDWMPFENTSQYFFNRLKSEAVTLTIIENLINLTINF